jgi:multiple sugar transport system permease protein
MDGANEFQIQTSIVLPLLKPVLTVITLLTTIWTFNNFVYVWLATGGGPGTFTNVLATEVYIKGFVDFRLGYSSAIGMVMAVIMGLFGILYMRLVARQQLAETL